MPPPQPENPMPHRSRRLALLALTLYPQWLAMMAVHEFGHVLHAWISRGHVVRVVLPLWGFSRTDVFPNPSPASVAWGGPVWGSLIPLGLAAILRRRLRGSAMFFAGFCCVINGAYLATGWLVNDGDAADLRRHDTPIAVLIVAGSMLAATGLYLWHRLGMRETKAVDAPV